MALALYYRLSWQILIVLTALLGVGSEVVRPLVALPFFVVSGWAMTGAALQLPHVWRRRLSTVLALAMLGLAIHEITRVSRFDELVPALMELLCGFLPFVLMTHERPRSYWLAVLTVVVLAIGSISVASSVFVYLAFLAFIACLLLNLNAANLRAPPPGLRGGAQAISELPRSYFRQFAVAVPTGGLAAVAIFLAFPRVESFTLRLSRLVTRSHVGYSGAVTLSGEGEIETSPALALLIEAVDKTWLKRSSADLRLRGDALDTFDGKHWSTGVIRFNAIDRVPDLRVAMKHQADIQQLQVHVEPLATSAVFYPQILLSLGPLSPGAGHVLANGNGSLVRDVFSLDRFQYSLRVAPPLTLAALPAAPLARLADAVQDEFKKPGKTPHLPPPYALTPADGRLDLAVPASVGGAPWFKAWRREVGIDPERDSLADFERHLDGYFATHFKASLANQFSKDDSLEAFLTTDRRGHCEYFATVTALLLRSFGLPTRVLVGYRGGTYNELIDMLEVREENAHAWVEVYVPGVGWHELDPTPIDPASPTASLGGRLRLFVNAATFWFHQYVIDYDGTRQRQLFHSLGHLGDAAHDKAKERGAWLEQLKARAKPLAVGVLVAGFFAYLWRQRRRRAAALDLPAWYAVFLRRVAAAGQVRRDGETFAAFHARLATLGFEPSLLEAVAAALEQELYAGRPLEASEAANLRIQVKRLELRRPA